ncbi:MAG: hypothetical protein QM489_07195 [Candidatus Izemoplasma sp.]
MLVSTLYKQLGTDKDWEYGKTYSLGYEKEYFVRVYQDGIVRRIEIYFQKNDNDKNLVIFLNANKKLLRISNFELKEEGLIIAPNDFFRVLNIKRLQKILDVIVNELIRLEYIAFKPNLD